MVISEADCENARRAKFRALIGMDGQRRIPLSLALSLEGVRLFWKICLRQTFRAKGIARRASKRGGLRSAELLRRTMGSARLESPAIDFYKSWALHSSISESVC